MLAHTFPCRLRPVRPIRCTYRMGFLLLWSKHTMKSTSPTSIPSSATDVATNILHFPLRKSFIIAICSFCVIVRLCEDPWPVCAQIVNANDLNGCHNKLAGKVHYGLKLNNIPTNTFGLISGRFTSSIRLMRNTDSRYSQNTMAFVSECSCCECCKIKLKFIAES